MEQTKVNHSRQQHRIRAAGIAVKKNAVLLLRVNDFSGEYWIPPGGGLEETDIHTQGCLKRECYEEAGIDVEVGELLCVREFLETSRNIYHAEFFYKITDFSGEPHINNLEGLNDAQFIQEVKWIPIKQLNEMRTFPTDLNQVVTLALHNQCSVHLGSYVQGDDEMCNQMILN
ncbi:NUDIX domain-containing protein [Vibrio rumoiensis]|uniref:Pyrophosphatase n=1 Tax=Vibrio rumoiensis 1S-45 TaxID=1188252 RepID=A0A1E5DZ82_9VIBR|nr:NUDIX domain-containing protein [Vibrio rumoiensis]OEF23195.1 pyrophosphatase [Vibrio rumoiensis 1S-45]